MPVSFAISATNSNNICIVGENPYFKPMFLISVCESQPAGGGGKGSRGKAFSGESGLVLGERERELVVRTLKECAGERLDFTKLSGRSNPVLEPVRGDVLSDADCCGTGMTSAELAKAEAYRQRRLERLLARLE